MSKHMSRHSSKTSSIFVVLFILFITIEAFIYGQKYFMDYSQNQLMFLPGFDTTINKVIQKEPEQFLGLNSKADVNKIDKVNNEKIAVIDDSGYHYILAAWYGKLSPTWYFATNIRQDPDLIGFRYGEQVANLHFIAHPDDQSEDEKILVQWINNEWKVIKP